MRLSIVIFFLLATSFAWKKIQLVFTYTTIPGSCGPFSDIFKETLQNAIKVQDQNEVDIIVLSNFKQCRWALHDMQNGDDIYKKLKFADSMSIKSLRTQSFEKSLKTFAPDLEGDTLFVSSLYRFFMMEDFMRNNSLSDLLYVEVGNMLYENMATHVNSLRKHYPGLTLLPVSHKRLISGSLMWVGSAHALAGFNDFLLALTRNESYSTVGLTGVSASKPASKHTGSSSSAVSVQMQFFDWLVACKPAASKAGDTSARQMSISDLSLLAFYKYRVLSPHLHQHGRGASEVKLFPVVPALRGTPHRLASSGAGSAITTAGAALSARLDTSSDSSKDKDGSGTHPGSLWALLELQQGGAEVGVVPAGAVLDSGTRGWINYLQTSRAPAVKSNPSTSSAVTVGSSNSSSSRLRYLIDVAAQRAGCVVHVRCLPKTLGNGGSGNNKECVLRPCVQCVGLTHTAGSSTTALAVGGGGATGGANRASNVVVKDSFSQLCVPLLNLHVTEIEQLSAISYATCACKPMT